jgi:hypothetical protein
VIVFIDEIAEETIDTRRLRQVVTTADKEDPEWARPLRRTA